MYILFAFCTLPFALHSGALVCYIFIHDQSLNNKAITITHCQNHFCISFLLVSEPMASSTTVPPNTSNTSIATPNATIISAPTHPKPTVMSFGSQAVSVKLDLDNYLLWQTIVLPIVRGYSLKGHIARLKSSPLEYMFENNELKINPTYQEWQASDQMLMG